MKFDKLTGRRRPPTPRASLLRHSRKCHICHHPQRAEIEDDFLNWHGPRDIVKDYQLPHYSVIYRHANALGLRARRNENIRTVLDIFVEQAETVPVTANAILRAIRAYSCLRDDGTWVELPKEVIYESNRTPQASAVRRKGVRSSALVSSLQHQASSLQKPNRKSGIRIRRNPLKTNASGQI